MNPSQRTYTNHDDLRRDQRLARCQHPLLRQALEFPRPGPGLVALTSRPLPSAKESLDPIQRLQGDPSLKFLRSVMTRLAAFLALITSDLSF